MFGFLLGGLRWTGVRNEEVLAADAQSPKTSIQLDLDRSSIEPAYRNWSADKFFDDSKVLELCQAIKARDFERIEHLVKKEGVDINARGHDNVTPLFWMFPLGLLEAYKSIPRDENGYLIKSEMEPAEQVAFAKHAGLMERLIELGADPNVKLSEIRPESQRETQYEVPLVAFHMSEGLAVTHLATRLYSAAKYNYFPMVMAKGGDPNLVLDSGAVPPIFLVVGQYFPSLWIAARISSPHNLALLIDAEVDLEFRAPDGNTPILAAAAAQHFDLVYMLVYAGADFRATNERGWGLPKYAANYLHAVQKLPEERIQPGAPRQVEAYFLDVVRFLEDEGVVAEGTHADYKTQIDRVVEKSENVVYADRDPFVDEWVAKRRGLQEPPKANTTDPKAKAPE